MYNRYKMCFKKSDKPKFITSRVYRYSSGHRYFSIPKNKNIDRILNIEVTNNKGNVDIEVYDKTYDRSEKLNNPSTGVYEFFLLKEHEYKITIITSAAYGGYKLTIRNKINVL